MKSTPPGPVHSLKGSWSALSKRQKHWMMIWCAWLIIPVAISYVFLSGQQRKNAQEAAERHASRLDVNKNDAATTQLERTPPAGHEKDIPTTVKVGAYLTRIPEFHVVDSMWKADFYVWFKWKGNAVNPGETFKIVSGEITSRTLMRKTEDGDNHYTLYRVLAEITKTFDGSRFPRDEHLLTIVLEDAGLQTYQMVYEQDEGSEMSSRVVVPGFKILGKDVLVKPHTYKTSMGDPALPVTYKGTYSDFVFGIPIARPSWGLFFKMFLPMYLGVFLAIVSLLVRGAGERIGLGSTGLFVAVVNGLTINGSIPDTGIASLADQIHGIGYFFIGQMILQAVFYHRYFADPNGETHAAYIFDRLSLYITSVLVVALNVGVLVAAAG